jgi:hypothetical protein
MNKTKKLTSWQKLSNALLRIVRRSYIYYENVNPMWDNGTIYVYVGWKAIKQIFVNDDDNPYDIIDKLKEEYKIKRVKEKHYNWR